MAVRITTKLKDRVYKMLNTYPVLRDSDQRLITNMWHDELPAHLKGNAGVREFFQLLATGYFTSGESITRARRQLQESNPSLRGNNYAGKQAHTGQVKEDLGYY